MILFGQKGMRESTGRERVQVDLVEEARRQLYNNGGVKLRVHR